MLLNFKMLDPGSDIGIQGNQRILIRVHKLKLKLRDQDINFWDQV